MSGWSDAAKCNMTISNEPVEMYHISGDGVPMSSTADDTYGIYGCTGGVPKKIDCGADGSTDAIQAYGCMRLQSSAFKLGGTDQCGGTDYATKCSLKKIDDEKVKCGTCVGSAASVKSVGLVAIIALIATLL